MNTTNQDLHSPATQVSLSRWPWLRHPLVAVLSCLAWTGVAVAIHFAWNVPPGEVLESARDQGAKKAAAAARKDEARTALEHEKLWRQWKGKDYEDEPVDASWARGARPLVHRSVTVARNHVFDGALEEPELVVANVTCRTVRCRFELRSPYAHEIDLMVAALEDMQAGKRPLWRSFDVTEDDDVSDDDPDAADDDDERFDDDRDPEDEGLRRHSVLVTVALRATTIQSSTIAVVGDADPAAGKAPPEPQKPATPAQSAP